MVQIQGIWKLRGLRKEVERGRCALCGRVKIIFKYFEMQGNAMRERRIFLTAGG
jgi:hypothetical protein